MQKIMFEDKKLGLTQKVLDGKKTQTRRFIVCPETYKGKKTNGFWVNKSPSGKLLNVTIGCKHSYQIDDDAYLYPKYKIGEEVAIAQRYQDIYDIHTTPIEIKESAGWNNKMFVNSKLMPYKLKITNVRVEKLQEISEKDCLAEGIEKFVGEDNIPRYRVIDKNGEILFSSGESYKDAYQFLIEYIKMGDKHIWENNPFVWVYEFELIE